MSLLFYSEDEEQDQPMNYAVEGRGVFVCHTYVHVSSVFVTGKFHQYTSRVLRVNKDQSRLKNLKKNLRYDMIH